jgi:mono/diheme cytochrome c family protein
MKYFTFIFLVLSFLAISPGIFNADDENIWTVLQALGEDLPNDLILMPDPDLVARGKEIVYQGQTKNAEGKLSPRVSIYYQCTSCHNQEREDPDLTQSDPEMRLEYVVNKKIPFLQATTFFGIMNRRSWYNGDYVKKYGDLVKPANESLEAAVQLCATECAQGRALQDWEMEAVMHYLASLQYKMSDLDLTQNEMEGIHKSLQENNKDKQTEAIALIKSKYLEGSPATFADAPYDKSKGYGLKGNPDRGQLVYEHSCQTCHKAGGVSEVVLDDSKTTFRRLKRKITSHQEWSIYQITRYGTYAYAGHRPYMPLYPLEKMSHQQLEDLRAYIEAKAK